MRINLKEKVMNTTFKFVVLSGTGTAFAGALTDKPGLMYGAVAGTFVSAIIGAHYHDTRERRIIRKARRYL